MYRGDTMKTIIATKSIKQILVSVLFLIFMSVIGLSILSYYQFLFLEIDQIMVIFLYVLLLAFLSLLGYVIYMLLLPKQLVSLDETYLYLHKIGHKHIQLLIKDIENVKANINIWAKPFLVYSSIEIETQDKKHYIRVANHMGELKEKLEHLIRT
jgi:hypothetical protein